MIVRYSPTPKTAVQALYGEKVTLLVSHCKYKEKLEIYMNIVVL